MGTNFEIHGPKLVGFIITAAIAILLVFVKLFYHMKTIISRRRCKTSNDQKSKNEEDIEMGIAKVENRRIICKST